MEKIEILLRELEACASCYHVGPSRDSPHSILYRIKQLADWFRNTADTREYNFFTEIKRRIDNHNMECELGNKTSEELLQIARSSDKYHGDKNSGFKDSK